MPQALRVCPIPGCPTLVAGGRCAKHAQASDRERGTRQQRGYGREHTTRFRVGVLRRDPICVCTTPGHGHGTGQCYAQATVADHHPLTKRELRAQGMDEHHPTHGRGLCKSCHDKHTAQTSPGGWNQER